MIKSGTVVVYHRGPPGEPLVKLTRLGPGDFFLRGWCGAQPRRAPRRFRRTREAVTSGQNSRYRTRNPRLFTLRLDEAAPYLRLIFRVQLMTLDTGPTERHQML